MPPIAIRTESLGKRYRIGALARRPRTLREALTLTASAPVRNFRRLRAAARTSSGDEPDLVWAVRDVSFEVGEGEVVGIIGRNGAGKSTLLKLLCRITEPTIGSADIYGRVGSLLEVGTGFHPELTGRDNIYLSGSILGMGRGYIDRRFDEIVDFAGIGRFLDTPVKRYSSGMYLRLAFAVAAHLEPEVLIVDEVLAVGDAEFQKKCLGKIGNVAREGRTVIFVSHDMHAIRRLCPRVLLLEDGLLVSDGSPNELVQKYLHSTVTETGPASPIDTSTAPRVGSGEAYFEAVEYSSDRVDLDYSAYPDGPLRVMLSVRSDAPRTIGSLAVTVYDQHGTKLENADTRALGESVKLDKGQNVAVLKIEARHLRPGVYRVGLWLSDPIARHVFDHVDSAFGLRVADLQGPGLGRKPPGPEAVVTCQFSLDRAPGTSLSNR
jgi:lipopolysaccharide transport system ATP-binding protein